MVRVFKDFSYKIVLCSSLSPQLWHTHPLALLRLHNAVKADGLIVEVTNQKSTEQALFKLWFVNNYKSETKSNPSVNNPDTEKRKKTEIHELKFFSYKQFTQLY